MKRINKKITAMILAATMMGAALTGCGKEDKLDGTQIVATVDDYEITLGMAHLILRENQASSEDYIDYLAEVYGVEPEQFSMWDDKTEEGITYGEQQKAEVMGSICELYAFKNHAADYDIELTEEDNKKIAAAAKQFMEDNTQKAIDALGVSESDIVTYLELVTLRGKMYEPMLVDVDRKVEDEDANQTTITLVEISTVGTERDEDGYLKDLTEDQLAEKEDLGNDIITAIKKESDIAKADIEEIAKDVDESVTVKSATFTTYNEEQYAVDKEVVKAVLKMKDGELNDTVIKGKNAYYVVRLDAMLDKEATATKKEEIISQRESEKHAEITETWTNELEIDLDYEVWAQVELTERQSFRFVVEEESESEE